MTEIFPDKISPKLKSYFIELTHSTGAVISIPYDNITQIWTALPEPGKRKPLGSLIFTNDQIERFLVKEDRETVKNLILKAKHEYETPSTGEDNGET